MVDLYIDLLLINVCPDSEHTDTVTNPSSIIHLTPILTLNILVLWHVFSTFSGSFLHGLVMTPSFWYCFQSWKLELKHLRACKTRGRTSFGIQPRTPPNAVYTL